MTVRARTRVLTYVLALAALAAAVGLRWVLDPVLHDALPLVTLFGAVAVSVWLGGYLPGLLVGILGYFACQYLFIEPRGELSVLRSDQLVGFLAYLFTISLIVAFAHQMRAARISASEGREVLRVTLASIGDAVITTDLEGRVTYLNAVAESLTGWTNDEARGQPLDRVFAIVNEDTRQPVENPVYRALRDGVIVGLANHTVLIRRHGGECPIDDSAAPIRGADGDVAGCVLIFRDVSAQRGLEKERASQLHTARLLASIVATSDDAIISKSLDGIIQSWNAAAERLFGYTAEEAVGRHISLVIPTERLAEEDDIIASLKAGQRVDHFETERVRRDGQRLAVSLTISPLKNEAGQVVGASKIVRDVTDRKRTEADRERLATLVESSTDFIGICDLQGIPFFVNRAGLEMVGLESVEEAKHTPVSEFFFPEDQPRIMGEFFSSVLEKGHGEVEVRFRHFKTGKPRWMAYKVITLKDAAGRPNAFATVSQEVTERKRLEDNLRKLAADLSDADRRKNEFLATLAHELRNPLAPLSNMLELVKRAGDDPETRQRAHDAMGRQLGQLVRLVDDLLDLNRITHNRLELRRTQVELSAVVQQAIEASRPLLDSAGHDLRVTLPEEPCYLDADPARLAQVFGNLLNNSGKYTPPRGTIWLTAECQADEVVVSVKDTGLGIPPDKLDSIFEMFTQVDRSLERSQGGLGIGLTLVKQLVHMHGGSVEAKSAGEGQGSEFIVRLPTVAATTASVTAARADSSAATSSGRKILIVDDNNDSAVSLAMLLSASGHETHLAHDGIAAIDAAARHRPAVVLLDIGLPKLNGHEVCRRIRQQPWGKHIVIIALTGWGHDDDRRKSEEAGFDGHLVKPVNHAALLDMLRTVLPPAREGQNTGAVSR